MMGSRFWESSVPRSAVTATPTVYDDTPAPGSPAGCSGVPGLLPWAALPSLPALITGLTGLDPPSFCF